MGNSITRNPILVSYAAKGILPYRGLGSGIKQALDAWPEIDFADDRDGCLFTVTLHRKTEISSGKMDVPSVSSGKPSGKILVALKQDGNLTIPELASLIGVPERSIERNIKKLQEMARMGPAAAFDEITKETQRLKDTIIKAKGNKDGENCKAL